MSNENEKIEGKTSIGINFSSQDGRRTWRERYQDGSLGPVIQTDIETNDKAGLEALNDRLLRERGLDDRSSEQ
ncbi:MAG: hypothetical protein ABI430_00735 [Candidatus Taylorbacteria bacterium]